MSESQPNLDGGKGRNANFAEQVADNTRAGQQGQCMMAIVPVQVKFRDGVKVVKTYAFMILEAQLPSAVKDRLNSLEQVFHVSPSLWTPWGSRTQCRHLIDGLKFSDLDMTSTSNSGIVEESDNSKRKVVSPVQSDTIKKTKPNKDKS